MKQDIIWDGWMDAVVIESRPRKQSTDLMAIAQRYSDNEDLLQPTDAFAVQAFDYLYYAFRTNSEKQIDRICLTEMDRR